MILQSNDYFDQLAELDPGTGIYRLLSRKQNPELTTRPPAGGYSMVDGTMLCLYRIEGVLYLRVGDREFKLTDDVTSTLTREDKNGVFRLVQGSNVLFVFKYLLPVHEVSLSLDPTPFIEEEDFDFLLFVHNVLTETGRRHGIYCE